MDEAQNFVCLKHLLVAGHKRIESLHVSLLDEVNNLVVREQILCEIFLVEDLAIGNLAHKQLYDDQKLLCMNAEANCTDFRRFT